MASNDPSQGSSLPRGLLGRRGAPAGKGTRLPSIRAPRDLTLGGVPKKTFAPNIPARRDKNNQESTDDKVKEGSSKSGRDRGDRGRGKRREPRSRQDKNVVQSHSIFEEGPTQKIPAKKGLGFAVEPGQRSTGGGGGAHASQGFNIKREKGEDKRILDNLLRDDFVDYEDGDGVAPVQLPLSELHLKSELKSERVEIKDIKKDVDEQPTEPVSGIETVRANVDLKTQKAPISAADLFTSHVDTAQTKLLFLQLPDVLPGDPPVTDEDLEKSHGKNMTEKDNKEKQNCSLSEFREGFIGKLRVRKSGKTELVLGSSSLDVTMGTPAGFLQELVSLRTQEDSGDLSVLGYINHKLICVPDFESMLST